MLPHLTSARIPYLKLEIILKYNEDLTRHLDFYPKILFLLQSLCYLNHFVYDFPERTIDLELAKKYLDIAQKSNWTNNDYSVDWFLNTGNFLVNKKTYLETVKFIFDNPNHKHLEADAMAFTTHWLRKNKKIEIVPDLCYEHRIRPQSYSHAFGSRGFESIQYHRKLLLQS